MKRILICVLIICMMVSFAACSNKTKIDPAVQSSKTLYVRKVELPEDFIMGADISSVIALENAGVKTASFVKMQYPLQANEGVAEKISEIAAAWKEGK